MTTYTPPENWSSVSGKTIIITGCASGIGKETALLAFRNGANLVLADWDEKNGKTLVEELGDESRSLFRKTDVSNWNDIVEIFEAAKSRFGTVHAVVSNAGINTESLLDDTLDELTGRLKAPSLQNLEVNLIAHMYLTKCAVHYFRQFGEKSHQIVLMGSAASFIDTPPLYQYCAAKAGVVGLMRGLRTQLDPNITINVVAPWMTVTPMLPNAIKELWGTLPANTPIGVAKALLLPISIESINGKTFFVGGNEIVEVEDKLHEAQPQWLGEVLSKHVDEGQRRLIPRGINP